jgi:hypothetical protein
MNPAFKAATAVSIALLSIVLLVSPGSASQIATSDNASEIVGTRTSWKMDADWNDEIDSTLVMDGFFASEGGISGTGLACLLTLTDDGDGGVYSIENAEPVFENVSFIINDIATDEVVTYQGHVGVVRGVVERPAVMSGHAVMLYYDAEIGLLLQANYTGTGGEVIHVRIHETDAFLGYSTGFPYVVFFAIAFSVLSVVFIATATVNDKKKRSKEACFSDECWS